MNYVESFRNALSQAGLDFADEIFDDGKLHRVRAKGDKGRDTWYVLHPGPPFAVAKFGSWRGVVEPTKWSERSEQQRSPIELEEHRRRMKQIEAERERDEVTRHAKARRTAAWILKNSKPPYGNNYLQLKRVRAYGELRQWHDALVVRLCDLDGTVHSLQFIGSDGSKRFLRGGRISGCFFGLNWNAEGPIVIVEGCATGASVAEATGYTVIVAMNCGNLLAVAKAFRAKHPDRDFIIAADNDAFTVNKDGKPFNPGVEKATEAAKVVAARLAVPQFADTTTKPTDFNDLHQLEGLNTVKKQIEASTMPKETEEEALQRLAALSPMQFDRCVKIEAAALNVSAGTLRKEVSKCRSKAADNDVQGHAVILPDAEPWPEPVDGAKTLEKVVETISRYVAMQFGAAVAVALWIAYCHAFKAFVYSPRLNIFSPEKRCGKTVLLDVMAPMTPRSLRTENVTPAVLFRLVDSQSPTLLLDECDTYLRDNDELRGLLNAGHKRGACALRCEGENNNVRGFKAFAPAVLAGIGELPGTLHDRSIVIPLVRAKPGEVAARFDSRQTQLETELCRKLARWTGDNLAALETADPILPPNAFNRLADNWRPLFAMAELAGGDWPQRAADAFDLLTSKTDSDAQGINTMLLADVREAFSATNADRLFSKALVEALLVMSDRPWNEIRKGHPISENWLAYRLRAFDVASKTLRIGTDRAKGYDLADFNEAFERFLPPEQGISKRDTVTNSEKPDANDTFQTVTPPELVTAQEVKDDSEKQALSRCHGSKSPAPELVEVLV
jgi:putative DNA primase/helicase